MDGWMDGWIWIDGWMDGYGWMDGSMDGFAEYNQQDATFHNLFISVRRSTCFRWFFPPLSGAQNCTYSVRYLSDQYVHCMCSFELLMMDGKTV